MSDPRVGIMRAALERIAAGDPNDYYEGFLVRDVRAALAEVDALPENDTETRLARIAELVESVWELHGHRTQAAHAYGAMPEIGRLARGEEPA